MVSCIQLVVEIFGIVAARSLAVFLCSLSIRLLFPRPYRVYQLHSKLYLCSS